MDTASDDMSKFEPSGAKVQIGDLHLLLAVGAGFSDLTSPSVDLGSTLTIGSGTEFQQFDSTKCRSGIYTYYWLYKPISA